MKTCLLVVATLAFGACATSSRPPNVVFILADDLGWGDLGSYGGTRIKTPHIDRLAAEGTRLTQFYAGNAVCAPSRCTLMTGKHPGHCHVRDNRNPPERSGEKYPGQTPLPASDVTLAEMLKAKGYATGAMGKWGLGYEGSSGDPNRQGFDLFYGYNCQGHAHNHYPSWLFRNAAKEMLPGNDDGATGKTHSQDRFTEEAVAFLRAHKNRPFFLYLPFTIPHWSLQAPEIAMQDYRGKFPEVPFKRSDYAETAESRGTYAAMVSHMDRAVGRVMATIADLGLDGDTMIFFSSDNGPIHEVEFFGSRKNLRAIKGSLYEGGIRVPMIARWPGKIIPGAVSDHVGAMWDVMATIAELTGASAPAETDSLSFAPTLLGGAQKKHDYLYWEFTGYGGQQAVRRDNWKAVRQNMKKDPDPLKIELFDLAADPGEKTDVAAQNADEVARMAAIMKEAHRPSPEFPMAVIDNKNREAP